MFTVRNISLAALILALAAAGMAQAAELTAGEKLCADYAHKKVMLEKRLRRGARPWEKARIQAELNKIAADTAKFCPKT